jgi:hypothetical protein
VPRNETHALLWKIAFADVQVGPADSARPDTHQYLARAGRRAR